MATDRQAQEPLERLTSQSFNVEEQMALIMRLMGNVDEASILTARVSVLEAKVLELDATRIARRRKCGGLKTPSPKLRSRI